VFLHRSIKPSPRHSKRSRPPRGERSFADVTGAAPCAAAGTPGSCISITPCGAQTVADTTRNRMLLLCEAHHRSVHEGYLIIEGTWSRGFRFLHADGTPYGQRRRGRLDAPSDRAGHTRRLDVDHPPVPPRRGHPSPTSRRSPRTRSGGPGPRRRRRAPGRRRAPHRRRRCTPPLGHDVRRGSVVARADARPAGAFLPSRDAFDPLGGMPAGFRAGPASLRGCAARPSSGACLYGAVPGRGVVPDRTVSFTLEDLRAGRDPFVAALQSLDS